MDTMMNNNYFNRNRKVIRVNNFLEYGRTGQKKSNGQFYEEFEEELKGRRAIEVYREMAVNDEIIVAFLYCIKTLIRQATFYIEPGGKTAMDKKAATFIEEALADITPGWTQTLNEILSFLTYGWSIFEICYKRRNGKTKDVCTSSNYSDGLIGWSKFAIRAQDTLYAWEYDPEHDDLIAFSQVAPPDYEIRTIPIEKCLHFRIDGEKENPEGRSVLRGAYKPYYFKSKFQVMEGIGIERDLQGLPILIPDEDTDIFGDDEDSALRLQYAQNLVSSIRRDAIEGVVLPPGWELKTLQGGTNNTDVQKAIERYDKRIAGTVMADFIILGQEGHGSYALAENKTDTFFLAISSYLDLICEVFNAQAIPKLINLNGQKFGTLTDYPKMKHSDIDTKDLSEIADYVVKLVSAGALTPDETLQRYLRQEADLPEYLEGQDYSRFGYEQEEEPRRNVRPQENQKEESEGDSDPQQD